MLSMGFMTGLLDVKSKVIILIADNESEFDTCLQIQELT